MEEACLTAFGHVTGTDLADEVIERASKRSPEIKFVAGDFLSLECFDPAAYDVVVTLENLSRVTDQKYFVRRLPHCCDRVGS